MTDLLKPPPVHRPGALCPKCGDTPREVRLCSDPFTYPFDYVFAIRRISSCYAQAGYWEHLHVTCHCGFEILNLPIDAPQAFTQGAIEERKARTEAEQAEWERKRDERQAARRKATGQDAAGFAVHVPEQRKPRRRRWGWKDGRP